LIQKFAPSDSIVAPKPLLADFCNNIGHEQTYALQRNGPLLDHLVGAQQDRLRHR
jgi:hypothetical protein